jgi:hypothetical protein|tara:strand:+ start:1194 stop:1673 length:480 start_codon:yes stop_codon:yes gene_type:complete
MSKKQIKLILTHISEKYNIPYNSLEIDINNITNNSITEYNKTKCHAYIMTNDNKVQCSRSMKTGDFCLTHFNQDEKNVLKYGKIDKTKIDSKTDIEIKKKKKIEKKVFKNPIDVEYITLNKIDYLFNPENFYIYDFDTHKKIGKLDNDLNIIKKYVKKS